MVVLTADAEFENSVRTTFGASSAIELAMVSGRLAEQGDTLDVADATVVVVDLDAGRADEMAALARLMARVGTWPPVIAVTQTFDENVARTLLQMRTADFLVKPVEPIDLVRACARVAKGPGGRRRADRREDLYFPPRGRRRRRHDACRPERHDSAQQRRSARQAFDLSGRSRLSTWLGRRLSRSRAAPQSG